MSVQAKAWAPYDYLFSGYGYNCITENALRKETGLCGRNKYNGFF